LKGRRGRKRPADAELLLSQVKEEFGKKRVELGSVKKAAAKIGVKPSSFYKYLKGETVPDMQVLRNATNEWGIKWKYLDPSEILSKRKRKVRSAKQFVFTFLEAMREQDIEIVRVGPQRHNILQVTLNIRFSA
jgi:transcriptional regulator with XRE-family HTH domain